MLPGPCSQTSFGQGHRRIVRYPSSCFVRMQDYIDPDIPSSSSAESMWDKIDKAQDALSIQSKRNRGDDKWDVKSLYPRYWQEVLPRRSPFNNNNKRAITNLDTTNEHSSFTVATFNTLARGLSCCGPSSTHIPPPLPKESAIFDPYGGFRNVTSPEVVFDYNVRKWRLLHVLLGGGLTSSTDTSHCHRDRISTSTTQQQQQQPTFDIIALQEMDEYNSFFRPLLVNTNQNNLDSSCCYRGTFQPKPNSPCVPLGFYSDGVALLWNENKFETIHRPNSCRVNEEDNDNDCVAWIDRGSFSGKEGGSMANNNNDDDDKEVDIINVGNQVYILVPLRIIGTHKCIVVGATHLKAKSGLQNERIRHVQAMELRYRAEKMAQEILTTTTAATMGGRKEVSVLLLGDFNSEPHESAVRGIMCSEKKDDDSSSGKSWQYQSAYPLPNQEDIPTIENNDSLYTTWKIRREGEIKRIIDYIFHASHSSSTTSDDDKNGKEGEDGLLMKCTHVLSIPKDEDVENGRYPGYRYPSDHLLIAAKFEY